MTAGPPEKADIAFVLAGDFNGNRVLKAAEMIRQKLAADCLVMTCEEVAPALIAEELQANLRAVRLRQLRGEEGRQPVAAKEVSHRGAGTGTHEEFVVLSFHGEGLCAERAGGVLL